MNTSNKGNVTKNNDKKYSTYVVDNTFCNDRSVGTSNNSMWRRDALTIYSGRLRLYDNANKTATLICTNQNDKFSKTSSYGNGLLDNSVALITVNEVALAGGKYGLDNSLFYLRTNGYFWTMMPSNFNGPNAHAYAWHVYPSGYFNIGSSVSNGHGARPVINLSSDVLITKGDGSISNYFEITR